MAQPSLAEHSETGHSCTGQRPVDLHQAAACCSWCNHASHAYLLRCLLLNACGICRLQLPKYVSLDIRRTRELVAEGIIAGGMIPK